MIHYTSHYNLVVDTLYQKNLCACKEIYKCTELLRCWSQFTAYSNISRAPLWETMISERLTRCFAKTGSNNRVSYTASPCSHIYKWSGFWTALWIRLPVKNIQWTSQSDFNIEVSLFQMLISTVFYYVGTQLVSPINGGIPISDCPYYRSSSV